MNAKTNKASGHISTANIILETMRKFAVEHENGVDSDSLSVAVEHLSMRAMSELESALELIGC